jgi:hypothetical protein
MIVRRSSRLVFDIQSIEELVHRICSRANFVGINTASAITWVFTTANPCQQLPPPQLFSHMLPDWSSVLGLEREHKSAIEKTHCPCGATQCKIAQDLHREHPAQYASLSALVMHAVNKPRLLAYAPTIIALFDIVTPCGLVWNVHSTLPPLCPVRIFSTFVMPYDRAHHLPRLARKCTIFPWARVE